MKAPFESHYRICTVLSDFTCGTTRIWHKDVHSGIRINEEERGEGGKALL